MQATVARGGVVLVAAVMLVAGCSGDDGPQPIEPFDESDQPVSSEPGVESDHSAEPELSKDALPAEFAGLYVWDPEAGSHTAPGSGVLVIEPPCVYINEIDSAGQTIRMPDGQLLRTLVRLPRALVRFDADANSIWVRDEGPMTTGDGVTLGGGYGLQAFGRRLFEEDCSANAGFTASSMTPGLDHMLSPGWDDPSTGPRELTNMFDWDPEGGYYDASLPGTLEIVPACTYLTDDLFVGCVAIEPDPEMEPRCVYVTSDDDGEAVLTTDDGDDGEAVLTTDGSPVRTLVRLPRLLTRYDPDTGELWVGDHGPMVSGEAVIVVGTEGWVAGDEPGEEPFEGRCAAHGSFWAASIQPIASGPADMDTAGTKSPSLAGMFPWDPKQDVSWYALDGTLAIEAPCVYIGDITSRPDMARTSSGEPVRLLLRLAQPLVRFDEDAGDLWVGADGPFVHGDKVRLGGGPNAALGEDAALQAYEGGCSAHEVFWTLRVEADGR